MVNRLGWRNGGREGGRGKEGWRSEGGSERGRKGREEEEEGRVEDNVNTVYVFPH